MRSWKEKEKPRGRTREKKAGGHRLVQRDRIRKMEVDRKIELQAKSGKWGEAEI